MACDTTCHTIQIICLIDKPLTVCYYIPYPARTATSHAADTATSNLALRLFPISAFGRAEWRQVGKPYAPV